MSTNTEGPSHTVALTKSLLKDIQDLIKEADDANEFEIWDTLEVNEPANPESNVMVKITGADDLEYELRLIPVA